MWYRGPYFLLSCVLLLAALLYPFAAGLLGELVLQVAITVMLFSAVYAVTNSRRLFKVMAALLLPTLAINWFADPSDNRYMTAFSLFASMAMFTLQRSSTLRDHQSS